jgi:putative tryptophan/tyrosine transport system substrate-binding protein
MRLIGLAVVLILSLTLVPRAAEPQQPGKVQRVGVLMLASLSARPQQWEAFRQGLREHGYVEERNILLEFRSAEGKLDRLAELAAELIQTKVDVIVASGTEASQAAKKATGTIPVVMSNTGDPVGAGIVANLARPGGNITGLSLLATELSAKRLELLKETLPKLARVAVLWNPSQSAYAHSACGEPKAGETSCQSYVASIPIVAGSAAVATPSPLRRPGRPFALVQQRHAR